jgi:hypothetical protein
MPIEIKKEIAHVLFIDIVGYVFQPKYAPQLKNWIN